MKPFETPIRITIQRASSQLLQEYGAFTADTPLDEAVIALRELVKLLDDLGIDPEEWYTTTDRAIIREHLRGCNVAGVRP